MVLFFCMLSPLCVCLFFYYTIVNKEMNKSQRKSKKKRSRGQMDKVAVFTIGKILACFFYSEMQKRLHLKLTRIGCRVAHRMF